MKTVSLFIHVKVVFEDCVRSFEPRREKTGLQGFRLDLTQIELHSTEDGKRLKISDLGRREIVLSM